jgi:hypothetical protein
MVCISVYKYFKGDKNPQHDLFWLEHKATGLSHKILGQVKDPLRYDRDGDRQNSAAISCQVLPALLIGVSAATRAENSGGEIKNDTNSDG